ncbi:hypothetical protein [Actinomadura parmotrematis]|uniref:Uncharacterized protein n=1 Tax=Actinomadura parmotrematis TaxID=2864039 RepID=A0ABS7FQF4_9ACTN|nr:hypothetical protein [Actinomadura parmotrematis]MBW8482455.1 hypothetical protein [Actinomadura parmotrematis]
MTESNDSGHEPEQTDDEFFAPVNEGADARGRTEPGGAAGRSGTGVPGVRGDAPDALPPDEAGVEEAERTDQSGYADTGGV